MIVACGKLKTSILELPSNMISALHKIIRYPDGKSEPSTTECNLLTIYQWSDSPAGKLIKSDLIPAIGVLRKDCPFMLDVVLPETFVTLVRRVKEARPHSLASVDLDSPISCVDVEVTDTLFDSFIYE